MREEGLIRKVKMLVQEYSNDIPFSNYLKDHFRNHPEMGARDRRETRGWCYNFLRLGECLSELSFENRLSVACFLCSNSIYPSLSHLIKTYSEFNEDDTLKSLDFKLKRVKEKYPAFEMEKIFPMHEHLSDQIKRERWYESLLKKPKVWIRVRQDLRKNVVTELNEKKISFHEEKNPLIISFSADVSLDKTFSYQHGFFEIQDLSSQRTIDFFKSKPGESWWDACAGSGGKSLMLKEENRDIDLLATDIRDSILSNYFDRMKKAGYHHFTTKQCDIAANGFFAPEKKLFDGIIADVPCSGSGTWSRSPEWLRNNQESRLVQHFVPLQRSIILNLLPSLKPGSPIIYITCSVFKEENEENVAFFLDNLPLKLEKSAYLEGYETGADTLFVARLIKLS